MNGGIKLNLGCGPGPQPAGWVHLDGSWNGRIARFAVLRRVLAALRIIPADNAELAWTRDIVTADLRRPLPFESQAAKCVYASHVLEHLYEDEARHLLAECYRVLKPDGVLRVVVPDLRIIAEQYVESTRQPRISGSTLPADQVNEDLMLRSHTRQRGHLAFRLYSAITEFHSHKWMYDAESLTERVVRAGFVSVERRSFLDSRISAIDQVERADRVLHGVCIEGLRPR